MDAGICSDPHPINYSGNVDSLYKEETQRMISSTILTQIMFLLHLPCFPQNLQVIPTCM